MPSQVIQAKQVLLDAVKGNFEGGDDEVLRLKERLADCVSQHLSFSSRQSYAEKAREGASSKEVPKLRRENWCGLAAGCD